MRIHTKAQHIGLTPAISAYVEKRLGSLGKYVSYADSYDDARVEVTLEKTNDHHNTSGEQFIAKANLDARTLHIFAEATDADLYAAIDKLKDELQRELGSKRERRVSLIRRGGQKLKSMLKGLNPWTS
jgi:putative sigma-54 modulation protein